MSVSVNVTVQPELLRWARQRVSLSPDEMATTMKVPITNERGELTFDTISGPRVLQTSRLSYGRVLFFSI